MLFYTALPYCSSKCAGHGSAGIPTDL